MHRATFIAGFAVGFVVGARAGRERYEQIVKYSRQVAGSPTVQKVTQTVTTKTTELTKTAMEKAPDVAKKAANRVPSRIRGKGGTDDVDDVSADGNLGYPAGGSQAPVNGTRYAD
ncbi:MAG TPA: hypothetical protein VKV38_04535 [Trebonia sp.]|jgi:hypothetical protein|nr:hypothetical protein [Trebonia sp.]